jgi:integrase
MASITRRSTSYQVQIRRKDASPVSKCFKSLAEAKAWARQVETALDQGSSPLASVRRSAMPSLMDALARYAAEVVPQKKGALQDAARVRQWQRHPLATKPLGSITAKDLSSYRDTELKDGKAPASVVRSLALLSHVHTVAAKDWGYLVDNPVTKIRKPRAANARSRRPTADELEAVLANLANPELRTFVLLAIETAMRRSELFWLTWDRVDLGKRLVFLKHTKNGDSRHIVLSTRAVELLALLDRNNQGRVFHFRHRDTPSKAFARAVARSRALYEASCGGSGKDPSPGYLRDLRLHDLRHEATSRFFERGLTTVEVASITGHKTLAMLQRYTHLSVDHLMSKIN